MNRPSLFSEYLRYALPGVAGMLALSCYILADTFFVARALGPDGLAALNLAIPVYSLIHGTGLMIGIGGATRFSFARSRGEEKRAQAVFTHALLLGAAFAALCIAAGLLIPGRIAVLLGADASTYAMCRDYLRVLLLFAPLFLGNNIMLAFVRNSGAPRLAMVSMIAGSLSNILFDYLLMFPLGLGMLGAALATAASPGIGLAVLSLFFRRGGEELRPARCRISAQLWRGICAAGFSSLVTELSSGAVMIAFNMILLALLGNTGVAAYGIVANLALVVLAIYTGLAQGIQPLFSRYCGLAQRGRLRFLLHMAALTVAALSSVLYAGIFFGAEQITALFNSGGDAALRGIAVPALQTYFAGCLFAGENILIASYLAATGSGGRAGLLSLARGFFVILPAAFLLSALWGAPGLWAAFPVAEGLVCVAAVLLFARSRRGEAAPGGAD